MPCCPTSLATGRTAPGTYHSGIPSTPKEPARVGSGLSKYTPVRFHVVFPSVTVKLPVSRYSGSTASIQHLLGHAVVDEALLDGQGLGIDLGVRTEAGEVVRPRHALGVLADLSQRLSLMPCSPRRPGSTAGRMAAPLRSGFPFRVASTAAAAAVPPSAGDRAERETCRGQLASHRSGWSGNRALLGLSRATGPDLSREW